MPPYKKNDRRPQQSAGSRSPKHRGYRAEEQATAGKKARWSAEDRAKRAGAVATTPKLWDKRAVDAEWKNLTARLISQGKADVVPVFFAGQNSMLFQLASHLSMTLRLSLLFKEVHDSIGGDVIVRVGEVIPFERLAKIEDRQQLMNVLREATYALGRGLPHGRKRAKQSK